MISVQYCEFYCTLLRGWAVFSGHSVEVVKIAYNDSRFDKAHEWRLFAADITRLRALPHVQNISTVSPVRVYQTDCNVMSYTDF